MARLRTMTQHGNRFARTGRTVLKIAGCLEIAPARQDRAPHSPEGPPDAVEHRRLALEAGKPARRDRLVQRHRVRKSN